MRKHIAVFDKDYCVIVSVSSLDLEAVGIDVLGFIDKIALRYGFDDYQYKYYNCQYDAIIEQGRNALEIEPEKRVGIRFNGQLVKFIRVLINYN